MLPDRNTKTFTLLGQSESQLSEWMVQQGQPSYRGKQLHDWLYHKSIHSLDQITVFPKSWRDRIAQNPVSIGRSEIHYRHSTPDGTVKYLLKLSDGAIVETVGIPSSQRLTVCVSSQVGCPMACNFCATGKGGFERNLAKYEIIDQVLTVQEDMQRRVSHLVFMGMGEPLLNTENLLGAIAVLNKDVGIGQRMMTVSTVGIPDQILKLAEHHLQATLAVSLHAPNQQLRQSLIPSADRYPLETLLRDCREYVNITGRRISFEYTLLAGVNDSPSQAQELAALIKGWQTHVNLIPYNPIQDADYQRPNARAIQVFADVLATANITVSIRRTRGLEAQAACGQLRRTERE